MTRRKFSALVATSSTVLISGCSALNQDPPTEYSITSTELGFVNGKYLVCVLECTRSSQTEDTIEIEFKATVDGFPQVTRKSVTVSEETKNLFFSIALPWESDDQESTIDSASVRINTSGEVSDWTNMTGTEQPN